MSVSSYEVLKQMIDSPSPSGYEQPAAKVFRDWVSAVNGAEVSTDVMGSIRAKFPGKDDGAPSVMLAGHIDEVGMMVTYVDDSGFLSFTSIGGIDSAILPGLRVDVHTSTKTLRGVVGRKPIHLISKDETQSVTPMDKLFIDLGMSAESVKKLVRIGDPITYGVGFEEIGDGFAVSRAFDDKMGAWICGRVLEEVAKAGGAACDLWSVGTVQEEIGMRGGETSTFALNPDIMIAVEATHATDYPDIDKRKFGDLKCGSGPVIARGPNINPVLFDLLVKAADKEGVSYQIEPEPRGTGTDANVGQLSRGGKAAALISVPLRYMHTPTEVISLADLDAAVKLLTRFVLDLEPNQSFVPMI